MKINKMLIRIPLRVNIFVFDSLFKIVIVFALLNFEFRI